MYTVRRLMRNEVNPNDPGSLYRNWHCPIIGRHIFSARFSSSSGAPHSFLDPPPCPVNLTGFSTIRINSYVPLQTLSHVRQCSSQQRDILDRVMRISHQDPQQDEDGSSPW